VEAVVVTRFSILSRPARKRSSASFDEVVIDISFVCWANRLGAMHADIRNA
jgi:hypothetical protein